MGVYVHSTGGTSASAQFAGNIQNVTSLLQQYAPGIDYDITVNINTGTRYFSHIYRYGEPYMLSGF